MLIDSCNVHTYSIFYVMKSASPKYKIIFLKMTDHAIDFI